MSRSGKSYLQTARSFIRNKYVHSAHCTLVAPSALQLPEQLYIYNSLDLIYLMLGHVLAVLR